MPEGVISRGSRILLVEDHELVGRLLSSIVEQLGYIPILTRTAADAVAFVALEGVALVIMDLNLPDASGLETAQRVYGIRPDLPIILTSAWPTAITKERLSLSGIRRLLEKPFTIVDLESALRELHKPPAQD